MGDGIGFVDPCDYKVTNLVPNPLPKGGDGEMLADAGGRMLGEHEADTGPAMGDSAMGSAVGPTSRVLIGYQGLPGRPNRGWDSPFMDVARRHFRHLAENELGPRTWNPSGMSEDDMELFEVDDNDVCLPMEMEMLDGYKQL